MSERIHGLAQLLPDKTSLEECSLEELQHITKRFPYFAPAQFLLLQKLKESSSPDYEAQHRKALLYFHDPLLFDYFISADNFFMDEGVLSNVIPERQETIHQQLDAVLPSADLLAEETFGDADEQTVVVTENEDESFPEFQRIDDNSEPQTIDLPPPPAVHTSLAEVPLLTEPDKVIDEDNVGSAEPAVLTVSPLQGNSQPVVTAESLQIPEPDTREIILAPPSAVIPVTAEEPSTEDRISQQKEESVQPATTEAKVAQDITATEPLAFEPFHTVDYFASQGIKVSSDTLPKDKLSHQLRSFTEWLKVMKRLPAVEMEAVSQTSAEKTVESLASHSVEGGDVVTEAMAEVWARQGNKRKAIETYNKLSLLNPSKKAYFADKIENLSGT